MSLKDLGVEGHRQPSFLGDANILPVYQSQLKSCPLQDRYRIRTPLPEWAPRAPWSPMRELAGFHLAVMELSPELPSSQRRATLGLLGRSAQKVCLIRTKANNLTCTFWNDLEIISRPRGEIQTLGSQKVTRSLECIPDGDGSGSNEDGCGWLPANDVWPAAEHVEHHPVPATMPALPRRSGIVISSRNMDIHLAETPYLSGCTEPWWTQTWSCQRI